MKSNYKFGTVSGIDLFVHWSFLVMLVGIFWFYVYQGWTITAALTGVGLVLAVFGCVILHELGHAFMARKYGIPTIDIIMYPIGGVARLTRMPKEPRQEMFIALAGPAVNLAIALVLFVVGRIMGVGLVAVEAFRPEANLISTLMWVNLGLVLFNMIPAFPMDGGRVLRAVLATKLEYRNATQIASLIGQGLALVFGIFGLFNGMWTLPVVAAFVFMAARQEVEHVMERS